MKRHPLRITGLLLLLAALSAACGYSAAADGTYVVPVGAAPPVSRTESEAPALTQPETSLPDTSETEVPTQPETSLPDASEAETQGPTLPEPSAEVPSLAPASPAKLTDADLTLDYHGFSLAADEVFDYEAAAALWGKASHVEQGQACIGGGYDKNYYWETVQIFTLAQGDQQRCYDIRISEPGFETPRGAVIGLTDRESVETLYGPADQSLGAADSYYYNETLSLVFLFSGGILQEVELYSDPQR